MRSDWIMNQVPGTLIANQRVQRFGPTPRLRLLIELEPAHRVFFRNLADLLLLRRVPQIAITSRPGRFWNDVFVPSGVPWSSVMESALCHLLLVVLLVWIPPRAWVPIKLFQQADAFHRSITYYPPTQSFAAAEGRAPRAPARSRENRASATQPAMPVTPEPKPQIITPPDIKEAAAKLPSFPDSHAVTPMVPFSATAGLRRNGLAAPTGVVAPPPEVNLATDRRLAPPQASAVAPAPEVGGSSTGRAMKIPNAAGLRIVPPPPSVQNTAGDSAGVGRLSSFPSTGPNVIPPAPSVQGAGNAAGNARLSSMAGASPVVPPPPSVQSGRNLDRAGQLSSLSGAGPIVVPPPPSLQGRGNTAGNTRLDSMAGASPVVPPPPSVQRGSNSARTGQLSSLSGAGADVVAPPPSVQGGGNFAGNGRSRLAPTGSEVVPPPPLVQPSGGSVGGARMGSLSGAGSEVVPPALSVDGADHAEARGRMGSLSGSGSQVAPTPPSVQSASNSASGNSSTGRLLEPMDPLPGDDSSSAAANQEGKSSVEELPLGLIGIVFAAPGTSYFSNFEVFVAKRRVGKDNDQLQLIKMVYEFLPYQRRLTEYNLSSLSPRVIKLRVTSDPSCDESLGRILQPQTDLPPSAADYPKLPEALRSADLNMVLPCYRTTAEDFQNAMLHAR